MTETTGEYIEARLEVPQELADAVCNFIIENICSGLVLEEEEGSKSTGISFYVATGDDRDYQQKLTGYLQQLAAEGLQEAPEIRTRTIRKAEWEEQYRQSVQPVRICDDVVVRPPWFEPMDGTTYDIIIEPRMAFGTGQHESTRSCLSAIRQHFRKGWSVLDLGCGSGILSILADQIGATNITAIDYDLLAVDNCRENFLVNQVKAPFEIMHGSIEKCDGTGPFDFVCANIIRDTIVEMLPRLVQLTASDGVLVLSGILDRYETEIGGLLKSNGIKRFELIHDNEWLTFIGFRD